MTWSVLAHEIPLPERPLLALDDQEPLAGDHEEVLLICLPVVHAHRLPGLENHEVNAELRKVLLLLEVAELAAAVAVAPARLPRVQDEPTFALRGEAVSGLLERRFRNHTGKLART
jgi:hypothetical protein